VKQEILEQARHNGRLTLVGAFVRLSGPGWLGSAFTLGAGSLAGSLFLGVIGGYTLLWVHPLAMLLGIVMLAAISYVTRASRA
jgi:Mn2+/Fe2+ NRAMP family transporter